MLVTSAGRRVELLEAFRHSARALELNLVIHACDLDPAMSAACHRADHAHSVPPADDPGYVDAIVDLAIRIGAVLVVPTIDPELAPLSTARSRFAAAGITLAVGSADLVSMARDKQATAAFLHRHGIPAPRSAGLGTARARPADWAGALFLKPCHGSSSRGVRAVDGIETLASEDFPEPMLVQDRLDPPEFTVNCFFAADGSLIAAVPHERLRVRGGEVEKGITRRNPELIALAEALAAALPGPFGPLCFQAMRGGGGAFRIFEINARFGGGYPLAHHAGAPFTKWLLEAALGLPQSDVASWQDGVTMLRHDSSLFLSP